MSGACLSRGWCRDDFRDKVENNGGCMNRTAQLGNLNHAAVLMSVALLVQLAGCGQDDSSSKKTTQSPQSVASSPAAAAATDQADASLEVACVFPTPAG